MSSRVLRKLQGDKGLANDGQNDDSDPESEWEVAGGAKKKQLNVNRFDLVRLFSPHLSERSQSSIIAIAGSFYV